MQALKKVVKQKKYFKIPVISRPKPSRELVITPSTDARPQKTLWESKVLLFIYIEIQCSHDKIPNQQMVNHKLN